MPADARDHVDDAGPATLSVIVPTLNSAEVLPGCLESLGRQTIAPLEVVVCDGGSKDGTVEIARGFGATVVSAVANRSLQRNTGALHATSTYVLFVDSDMHLSSRVVEECLSMFREPDAALVIPEVFVGQGFWGHVRGFERSFYDDVWWVQAARCYRREQFFEVGGFDIGLLGGEDWDLDERIRSCGSVRTILASIEHREGRVRFSSLLTKKAHYANSFETFRAHNPSRAALCLSTKARLRILLDQRRRLITHPTLSLGLAVLGASELAIAQGWARRWPRSSIERPLPHPDAFGGIPGQTGGDVTAR